MTHACCPGCRLRFSPAVSAYLLVCPECGKAPQAAASRGSTVGFRLFIPEELPRTLMPETIAVAIPIPVPTFDADGRGPMTG